jgi:uncharacterized protein (UPF0261 family)
MAHPTALVLATLNTKAEETRFLLDRLRDHGVQAEVIDISLDSGGAMLDGPDKLARMQAVIARALEEISGMLKGTGQVVLGLGGGTGGEIALRIMRGLPITSPKVLVTTMPFDPRIAAADTSIILVPTLADICGLNPTLREVLENVAAMTQGLCTSNHGSEKPTTSVGITGLGATEGAISRLITALRAGGEECTVFHSNGYGGAAFARFAERGDFHAIIDLTPHEMTRLHLAGAHVEMPQRFIAAADVPRIVLPGGLNFLGLGEKSLVPPQYLNRAHYAHSGFFTHAKLTPAEMEMIADKTAEYLNTLTGPVSLIVPMGGFSHQDSPGGAIEDPTLRRVFLDRVQQGLKQHVEVQVVDAHIASAAVTDHILSTLDALTSRETAKVPHV